MSLQFSWLKRGEQRAKKLPLLSIKGLAVRVGIREVLKEMELTVYPGDHILITGPNGSGKSTLLNAIAGVEPAIIKEGKIEFNGADITGLPPHKRASLGIAYMRQTDNVFPGLTVAENLRLALGDGGPENFAKTFLEWIKDMPMTKPAGLLSGGQKKKLAWGMTVLRNDIKLVLLDEPRAGVKAETFDIGIEFNDKCVLEIEHNH